MEYKRVYAEVDLGAIKQNLFNIKEKIGDTKLCAVIKADGYGHGALKTAIHTMNLVDFYAVATIEEALELRVNAIKVPIMILGYVDERFYRTAIENEIRLTIFDFDDAKRLSEVAVKANKSAKIHIKLETGMGRIGFLCNDESFEYIKNISELEGIEIEGIFTHFATADSSDKTFSDIQNKMFSDFCDKLKDEGVDIPIRHISNSAGILDMEECRCDMVRAGIIIYGYYPSEEVSRSIELTPALSWKSHIVHIKKVEKGVSISYGRTYVTEKETIVATVPVGYEDGYRRSLSSKGRVLINGKFAPVIGRVCMDQFMVDITEIPAKVGDDVTLIGQDGENKITADDIARWADTINYEIICNIGERVPRVYK